MITARVGMYILVNHLYTHLQRVGVGYFKQLKKSARDALRSAKKLCSFLAKNIADELDELINTGCYSFGILTFGHDIHILIIFVVWEVLGPLLTMLDDLFKIFPSEVL